MCLAAHADPGSSSPAVPTSHNPRLASRKCPGKLFRFLQETLRQARAFVLRETIAGDCRHYLADASWLSSNDTKRLADRTVVLVDDNWTADDSLPVPAIIVPSFKSLNSSRQENVGRLRW